MSPADLQQYLHEHIPLSKAMSVTVVSVGLDTVILNAPLQPNINHRETVFGGSASALAILAAWCLIHTKLTAEGIASRLVIHENTMSYDKPITGEFTAVSRLQNQELWPKFKAMLHRKGKARISVAADLIFQGEVTGRFTGEFVALGSG
jgi:thioesterase domain-containing protein